MSTVVSAYPNSGITLSTSAIGTGINNASWSADIAPIVPDNVFKFLVNRGWEHTARRAWRKAGEGESYLWSDALLLEMAEVFLVMEE